MTCIAGVIDKGKVWIAGDSASTNSRFDLEIRSDEKVFVSGPYVMGFTTSWRMGQLLRYSLNVALPPEEDLEAFMCTTFIDAVRQCLKDGGFASKESETEQGGSFLVGVRGRLFAIYDDYQVSEETLPYCAVGCGAELAKGALFAAPERLAPKDRLLLALRAAERFSAGVRAPFYVVQEPDPLPDNKSARPALLEAG